MVGRMAMRMPHVDLGRPCDKGSGGKKRRRPREIGKRAAAKDMASMHAA